MLSPFFFGVVALGALSVGSQIYLMRRKANTVMAREHQWQSRYGAVFMGCFAAVIAACDLWPAFVVFFGIGEQVLGVKVTVTFFAAVFALLMTLPAIEYRLKQRAARR